MNDLQKLLLLRGLSVAALAREIGLNYHSTQKVVRGVRHTPHVQAAVARYFGLTRKQVFGAQAARCLGALIESEIAKKQQALGARLKARYLSVYKEGIADWVQTSNG